MGTHAGMISLFMMYVGEKFLRRPVGIYMLYLLRKQELALQYGGRSVRE
jgi:hypothetical protein